ncbi:MAG: pyridoxamine 5'-phosphate oxidase family protein [Anaerovorax sp.]
MFREMRRIGNATSEEAAVEILKNNTNGVLAVHGDDGYPYAVPLSYAYQEGKIYFHGAVEGYKLESIKKNEKVSFCVVGADEIIPEEFNTLFKSVIVFGKAKVLDRAEEKQRALEAIIDKYSQNFKESGRAYIEKEWDRCVAIELTIEHMTGKAGD